MAKYDTAEMNSEIFLLVNPYEVNPGNSRFQNQINTTSQDQISPSSIRLNSGEQISYEYQEVPPRRVKVEMEEFSDLGDFVPSLRGRCVMDEFTLLSPEKPEENLEDFVDEQNSQQFGDNQQYIDKQQLNIELIKDELNVLQRLSNGCANSELKEHSYCFENRKMTNAPSNTFYFDGTTDSHYSNVTSPLDGSEQSLAFPNPVTCYFEQQKLPGLNLDVKFFMGDALNTPDILESVVSLEDDRFNFLNRLNDKKLSTINGNDLKNDVSLEAPSPDTEEHTSVEVSPVPEVITKSSHNREFYDDEDYIPPRSRAVRKSINYSESESESDEEYVPTKRMKVLKKRTQRISSMSSDCSKDSKVSKYRELRDKNNEASRKSRLKRKVKEREFESEVQELEVRNTKLKTQVQELQRMVDNLRSNLFQIMMKK